MTRMPLFALLTAALAVNACGADSDGVPYQALDDAAVDASGEADSTEGTDAVADPDAVTATDTAGDTQPDVAEDTAIDTTPGPDAATLLEPAGTWAQLMVSASLTQIPVVGQATTTATSIVRLQVTGKGATAEVTGEVCTLELDSGTKLVQTIAPQAFIDSVEYAARTLAVQAVGAQTQLAFPKVYEVRGAKLTDPVNEALPTTADDPRVYDQDKDGKPGVTVQVKGLLDGQIWLVQRGWQAGTCTLGDTFCDGLLQWGDEQKVLGSDNALLKNPNPSTVHPDAAKSYFRSTRLPTGLTCDEIVAQRDKLFAR